MSKSSEWREAIEKAKGLEQRFELSNGQTLIVAPAGVNLILPNGTGIPLDAMGNGTLLIEVDDAELVKLGSWLYETFYEEPVEGQEP